MPVNNIDYVVFDFETGGLKWGYNEVIQVAGKAYNARSLEPYPAEQGGEFESLMKPLHFDRLDPKALAINGKTVEQLQKAPDQGLIWNQFVSWVGKWNKGKGERTAPIPCGQNIRGFDLLFIPYLNDLHCKKKGDTVLFNTFQVYDLKDDLFRWFENDRDLADYKLDTFRDYTGMPKDGAHDALVDVRHTGEFIMKFLKLHRKLRSAVAKNGGPLIQFKDCYKK